MSEDTPLTDLQIAMYRAVDLARALPSGSVSRDYEALIGSYLAQVIGAVREARS